MSDDRLFRPLDEIELTVLEILIEPIRSRGVYPPVWPTRDFVIRRLAQQAPGVDLDEVLRGLPTVEATGRGRAYGVCWVRSTGGLPDSEVMGLTIAGIARLRETGRFRHPFDDMLVQLIADLAAAAFAIPANPIAVVMDTRRLDVGDLAVATREQPVVLPPEQVAQVLSNEWAYVPITSQGEDDNWVQLRGAWLNPFIGLTTAAEYEAKIANLVPPTPAAPVGGRLPLTQTLDYLSYVLAADPRWTEAKRLVTAPDLESATAFSQTVLTRTDFQTALAGVWNVINQLAVPSVPDTIAKREYGGKQPGSIGRMREWLHGVLDSDGYARAEAALALVTAIGRLRNADAHGSATMRGQAIDARRRLGLPEVITDWDEAWVQVTAHLAAAFDTVRREVQLSATADN